MQVPGSLVHARLGRLLESRSVLSTFVGAYSPYQYQPQGGNVYEVAPDRRQHFSLVRTAHLQTSRIMSQETQLLQLEPGDLTSEA